MTLVVDGQLLGEEEYKREADEGRPANISLVIGSSPYFSLEYTGQVSDLNIFSSPLSLEMMIGQTTGGGEECGTSGDLVNWEESKWTLHSQAKIIKVEREWEGPCRREPKVQVFTASFEYHQDCMHHCAKVSGGRSPPVTTREEWEYLTSEVDLITRDRSILPLMWTSATEGEKKGEEGTLGTLDHWNDTEVVNNTVLKLHAEETIWRDFYTGQRLGNWSKPYFSPAKDALNGETHNCMLGLTRFPWESSWYEWQCKSFDRSCPCGYPGQPVITALQRLLGLCKYSNIEKGSGLFSPKQLPADPDNMLILGKTATRIFYDDTSGQWVLTNEVFNVTAVSRASKISYLLGKHKWTISNDAFECNEGKPYTTLLKLSGCAEDEFTCDDGQCIKMERRCDQVTGKEPNCRDESDENGCKLIVFKNNYNKNIPPIGDAKDGSPIPTDVSITMVLMKVVEIEEEDHSIHLQFQISFSWKENRVKYLNLKNQTSLNALTDEEISHLWLPLIVYDNTDQKEVTRLGENWEWATRVTVTREGDFSRSDIEEVDEAEIFEGAENRLTMNQTYTWEFQCQYMLQRYPFDTQVRKVAWHSTLNISRNATSL